MEPVAIFPEGSAQLCAAILEGIKQEEDCPTGQAREHVLAASAGRAKVAEGSFGKVYSLAPAGQAKVVKQVTPEDARTACNTLKEGVLLSVMSSASQDYIPALHDCFLDDASCFFVMDQAHNSLDAQLPIRGPAFPHYELGVLSVSLLAAVHGFHVTGLLHNDLKPKNLLLAGRPDAPSIQIIDLDAATLLGMPTAGSAGARNSNGTTAYLSPERLLTGNCSIQSDMWAIGIIVYELLEGRRKYPFNWQGRRMTAAMMEDRIGKLATRGVSLPSSLKSGPWGPLLQGLLHKDPARRWGIRECACFPGFQDAFFTEAAARASPTHAALIHQLLAMRKVWQAAATCWQYEGIRQSLCQDVDPWAVHQATPSMPSQQIGKCMADEDESDGECEDYGTESGRADVGAGCPLALAASRTVSTIVFSSDDDDDDDDDDSDCSSGSSSGSDSGGGSVIEQGGVCGNDMATCDQNKHIVEGLVPADGNSCGKGPGTAVQLDYSTAPGGMAADHTRRLQGGLCKDDGMQHGLLGSSRSSTELQRGSPAVVEGKQAGKDNLLAAALEITPRPAAEDDTKSSFRIAAAWPPGDSATIFEGLRAADLHVNSGIALSSPEPGSMISCGGLLEAQMTTKMYIKSTLADKASPTPSDSPDRVID